EDYLDNDRRSDVEPPINRIPIRGDRSFDVAQGSRQASSAENEEQTGCDNQQSHYDGSPFRERWDSAAWRVRSLLRRQLAAHDSTRAENSVHIKVEAPRVCKDLAHQCGRNYQTSPRE